MVKVHPNFKNKGCDLLTHIILNDMNNTSDFYLIQIAEQYLFENNIVKPHLQCERVSQGLSLLLTEMGIDNKIRVAEVDISKYDGDLSYDVLEHHFIMIGRKVLDATASQFKGMPQVYYGSLPMWYKTFD